MMDACSEGHCSPWQILRMKEETEGRSSFSFSPLLLLRRSAAAQACLRPPAEAPAKRAKAKGQQQESHVKKRDREKHSWLRDAVVEECALPMGLALSLFLVPSVAANTAAAAAVLAAAGVAAAGVAEGPPQGGDGAAAAAAGKRRSHACG